MKLGYGIIHTPGSAGPVDAASGWTTVVLNFRSLITARKDLLYALVPALKPADTHTDTETTTDIQTKEHYPSYSNCGAGIND